MRKMLSWLEKGLLVVATAGLLLMMLSITVDAMGRHVFNSPLRGNFEMTSLYFMVILVFATLSSNYAHGVHVRLDVASDGLKRRFGKTYTRVTALICLPVFALFAWYTCIEALAKFQHLETRMGAIPFPVYLSYVWVALGTVTLALRCILDLVAPLDIAEDAAHGGGEAAS
ncbi:MAG: TRAP transporter small permease [Rhodobacteraceae bacterium]|nr:TRAP transporter small permease [Paracoccaceae bacterium]